MLKNVKGIGETRLQKLSELGITSIEELLYYFPKRYVDLSEAGSLAECKDGQSVLVTGTVIKPPARCYGKNKRRYILAECESLGNSFSVLYFNADFVLSALNANDSYIFYGRVSVKGRKISLVNPTFEPVGKNQRLKGLMPIYSLKGRFSQGVFNKIVLSALKSFHVKSLLPEELRESFDLMPLPSALSALHKPQVLEELERAKESVLTEQFLSLAIGCKISGLTNKPKRNQPYCNLAKLLKEYQSVLPYELTNGQKKALSDIINDLENGNCMNRLLQGDVGCGKTAVALFALLSAVKSGYQGALLCPTEVLARQHFENAQKLLSPFGVKTVLLTGSSSDRKSSLEQLTDGTAQLAIGTHALLTEDITFKNLQLIAVDEQQRFGVRQRSLIEQKGHNCDVLSISATPIPRTLSLLLFGNLTLSEIKEKPAGRGKIITRLVGKSKYADMFEFIKNQAKVGCSSYIVCPLIYGEEDEPTAATELYSRLKKTSLKEVETALLYGSMSEKSKAAALKSFKEGKIKVLISTTVIEVGVDAPDAAIMCIMCADRFGLSQLHQLRGRVGRGRKNGWCFLCSENPSQKSKERLKVLTTCDDGFLLSEKDLQMRGSGDFFGTRQSGDPELNLPPETLKKATVILSQIPLTDGYNRYYRSVTNELSNNLKEITLN